MTLFAAFGIGMIVLFVLMVLIGGFFMWIAAKIARVEKSSFGRAIMAALASSFVSIVAAIIFNLLPVIGNLFGFLIGIVLSILVIKAIFSTSIGKALLVWIFDIIATAIALVLASAIAASSIIFARCLWQ